MKSATCRTPSIFAALLFLTGGALLAAGGPGLHSTPLMSSNGVEYGTVDMWNTSQELMVEIQPFEPWLIERVWIYLGAGPVPLELDGDADLPQFPFKKTYSNPVPVHTTAADLADDLGFSWGQGERLQNMAALVKLVQLKGDRVVNTAFAWAYGANELKGQWGGWWDTYELFHPQRGQFIDSPVFGLTYAGPTQQGVTAQDDENGGGFLYFPAERLEFSIGTVRLGTATAVKKVSPLDLFPGSDTDDPRVIGVARILQSLDNQQRDGKIVLLPRVVQCFEGVVAGLGLDEIPFGDEGMIDRLIMAAVRECGGGFIDLRYVGPEEAQANLEAGLNASGIFRKNVSKTEDWAETKQKLDVMPVYFPGKRSNGEPSMCDEDGDGVGDREGVPYEEWRLFGDPDGDQCDPRVEDACELTLIECREVAKPLVVTYMQKIDIFDDSVTTDFYEDRFSHDIFTAVSRDDGTTWKRMNVSRMADLTSFDLLTGEPFPGTCRSPQQKIVDNNILVLWTSTFCKSGNPRYAIEVCEDPDIDSDGDGNPDTCLVCHGDPDQGTEVCELDYTVDDPYHTTDIWGVRGQQQSVDYDEVDEVETLGIGEIPYSCLWGARGVVVSQKELDAGTFDSLIREDDPTTEEDESRKVELGDIVWFKPERLTSGRRDAYIEVAGGARGAGFAVAWQEDPEGLRPGKGKGPGQGWSGAISNHKTDIWYSYLRVDDFAIVDESFVPGGEPDTDRPGVGRPKALVPMSLPVRVSDNDMVNTDTLKVVPSGDCFTPPDATEAVCFPAIDPETGTFTPLDPLDVEHGNAVGTKRYAYLAKTIDDDADGVPDYGYYESRGGTLDLCDTSGDNEAIVELPGTAAHERWFGFANTEGSSKLVCVTDDGRLLDGDVSPSRPNIQLQPYTKSNGTKSAWVLLAYEETKGMGHPHAEDTGGGEQTPKPIKQDYGKDVIYHTFDFTQPDLVAPGHVVNLPALCGGVYENYCEHLGYDSWDPEWDSICTCEPGKLIPLFFETRNADGEYVPGTAFKQYRTEVARRTRFIVQGKSRMGDAKTLGAIIFKQGQEGQGRPADVFIRRFVLRPGDTGNPYKFENLECEAHLGKSDPPLELNPCPSDGISGYSCNVWGEASGDLLCGGLKTDRDGFFTRRDHVNLTSADIDLAVDAGPDDDTPDDPTDDIYGTDKVLLWSQHDYNLGNESFGFWDGVGGEAGMFSNSKSHRGFIRGDFLAAAYAFTPNWASGRNGRDRYNFYIRKSFDGGRTWTTTPAALGGVGIHFCREWRTDPDTQEAPIYDGFDPECVDWCAPEEPDCVVTGRYIGPQEFEPAKKVSMFDNNKETSADPRVGATPPQPPLDGRVATLPVLRFTEDYYTDNNFFVAWGSGDNLKSTGGMTVTPEAPPIDLFYTRTQDYGDHFLKVPWNVNPQGNSQNWEQGELVWRYDFMAHGEEEQGECQLRATPDGSKMYAIYHQMIPEEEDPDEPLTRWYPWEPEESHLNDIWFRRVIFWPDEMTTP